MIQKIHKHFKRFNLPIPVDFSVVRPDSIIYMYAHARLAYLNGCRDLDAFIFSERMKRDLKHVLTSDVVERLEKDLSRWLDFVKHEVEPLNYPNVVGLHPIIQEVFNEISKWVHAKANQRQASQEIL